MSIVQFSVRNPVAMNLLMLLVVIFGLYQAFHLSRGFFPEVEPERIVISTR